MGDKQMTAGMQFLGWYNKYVKEYGCPPSDYDVNYFWKHNYFEMERQQIIDACKRGYKRDSFTPNFREQQELFEQYYNETFKSK